MITAAIAALAIGSSAQSPTPALEAIRLLDMYGGAAQYPTMFREALATFIEVEQYYGRTNYSKASEALTRFWQKYPPATEVWRNAYGPHAQMNDTTGINVGTPSCYYALRMYDECLRWRLANPDPQPATNTATLSIVLVGASEGLQPGSKADLENGTGLVVRNTLDKRLTGSLDRVIHESVELFGEYTLAASQGKLAMKTRVVSLPNLTVPVHVKDRHAGMMGEAFGMIWKAVPQEVKDSTDWWWVIYPSHVPEQHDDFARTEFITGGMGGGPDGGSPCFISDDRWLVRKPPHIGLGPYTSTERRAYLPQWLQHEMAHHWFRTWPEFKLEEEGHQWFDRSTWPADFKGFIEPDYYASALNLRIQPMADPPMHIALTYAPPDPSLFRTIKADDILGAYAHQPKQNAWHEGEITFRDGSYHWTNEAGRSWKLAPDLKRGVLRTGPDCPYASGAPEGPPFRLQLARDAEGRYTSKLIGFRFQSGLYLKK